MNPSLEEHLGKRSHEQQPVEKISHECKMTFAYFNKLPQELRNQIWAEAIAIERQQIVDEPCTTSHAERQRQALLGYDSIPDSKDEKRQREHLRLYIYASSKTDELRLGKNEFQTLINRFSVATACSEARAHVIEFCRRQIEFVTLFRIIEDQPSTKNSVLKNPVLEQPVFTDMTTVMVTTARFHPENGPEEGFDSPDQVVEIVARVFGNGVKKIIWSAWCHPWGMDNVYWPHTPLLGQVTPFGQFDMIDDSGHSETAHFLSPDLVLHIQKEVYEAEIPQGNEYFDYRLLLRHTLKLAELARAAAKPLPQLQHIDVEVRTGSWGEIIMTRLETTYKNDVIWIGKHNMLVAFNHGWTEYT
ncbi:hypothetical protein DM02DRAFT_611685 [Periconia macrospinosa]|uniref:2EXR domain-containing protein n=1 Tax=Periconia macrospinosa TaxID=97972 RepID=A0A2V1E135_9PLEO|nr:hypothetical protein DM02DRAFT_611685 [Periconia macrospinosa]